VTQKAEETKRNLFYGIKQENVMRVFIKRNSSFPLSVTKPCSTAYDNQTEVDVKVLEGNERRAEGN